MNVNYILCQFLDIKDLKITSNGSGFFFEGNGTSFDGSMMAAEEAFLQALIHLRPPEIVWLQK